jgi:hypothetical protein
MTSDFIVHQEQQAGRAVLRHCELTGLERIGTMDAIGHVISLKATAS